MITISGTLSKGWMAKALGVKFDRDYYFDPQRRYVIDCQCNEYAAAKFPDMRLFYSESNLGQIDYWDNSQILIGGIQPNMILGMLLGADLVPQDSCDADITPGCLIGKHLNDLPAPERLLDNEVIKLFDEQIRQIQNYENLRPIPPFFWDTSGRATIHGLMTTAQKFLGEGIFMDMIVEPQRSMDIIRWIGDAYILLCRHFAQIADLPITGVHVGECSSCMVGPDLIKKFVVPATSKIGKELGPLRLHSCGPSTNHLKAFSTIENLISLDLGGDTSISKARQIFGNEMLLSVSPLPRDMSDEKTNSILNWARHIIEENDDGNLEFIYHVEASYNIDTIHALTDFVKALPGPQEP
ncbi:MAG: hypothetical protein JXM79_09015 [Sedimentisphaerales bacterium]|nr:hypothetical protein [Sedimentisphaerales bacterium]